MYQAFPPNSTDYFDGNWAKDGLTIFHIYQVGVAIQDGYQVPSVEELIAMTAIQIAGGCKTDPSIPGIDALAIKPSSSDIAKKNISLEIDGGTINTGCGIQSVGFIKGRKRSWAALLLAIATLEMKYDVANRYPVLYQSLRGLHATVKGPFDDKADFLRSMQITVGSSITRVRPHIIVWVHNFRRFGTDQSSTDTMCDEFDAHSIGGAQAKLSKKERYALHTLLFYMDPEVVDMIEEYLKQKGMSRKSYFTLDALTSPMWRLGMSPTGVTPKYERLLKTTPESEKLVAGRIIRDDQRTPPQFRKTPTQADVDHLFLITNFFQNNMEDAKDTCCILSVGCRMVGMFSRPTILHP